MNKIAYGPSALRTLVFLALATAVSMVLMSLLRGGQVPIRQAGVFRGADGHKIFVYHAARAPDPERARQVLENAPVAPGSSTQAVLFAGDARRLGRALAKAEDHGNAQRILAASALRPLYRLDLDTAGDVAFHDLR